MASTQDMKETIEFLKAQIKILEDFRSSLIKENNAMRELLEKKSTVH